MLLMLTVQALQPGISVLGRFGMVKNERPMLDTRYHTPCALETDLSRCSPRNGPVCFCGN